MKLRLTIFEEIDSSIVIIDSTKINIISFIICFDLRTNLHKCLQILALYDTFMQNHVDRTPIIEKFYFPTINI